MLSLRGDFNLSLRSSNWLRLLNLWLNWSILIKSHTVPFSSDNPVPDWFKFGIRFLDILFSVVFRLSALFDEEHFLSVNIFRIKLLDKFVCVIYILQNVFLHVILGRLLVHHNTNWL